MDLCFPGFCLILIKGDFDIDRSNIGVVSEYYETLLHKKSQWYMAEIKNTAVVFDFASEFLRLFCEIYCIHL